MVEEINVKKNCKFAELQEHSGFQVLTKVGNYTQSGSLGFMTKCHLDRRKMTLPCKERSDGQALILGYLAAYSATIHVDVIHTLSLSAMHDNPDTDGKKKRSAVHRPKPQV